MFVEDTYSSEEIVDQQTVLLKVMDTADQVMIYSKLMKPICLFIYISLILSLILNKKCCLIFIDF